MSIINSLASFFKKTFVFLVAPLGILFLGSWIHSIYNPLFYSHWDPDYAYLFNGLSIYSGEAPSHIDHPGATLQSFIALYFLLREGGISALDLYYLVITDPEKYLREINLIILLFLAMCNYLLGVLVCKTFKSKLLGILSQLMIFMSPGIVLSLSRVNPDPLLYGFSILLFFPALFFIHALPSRSYPNFKFSALLLGLGFATKLTMLPFFAITYFYIRKISDTKNWLFFILIGIITGTIVWILNWKNYFYVLRWIKNLVLGSSLYGGGNKLFINLSESAPKFLNLLSQEFSLSIIFLITFGFIFFSNTVKKITFVDPEARRLLTTILMVQTLSLLLVLKHPLGEYTIIGEATRYLIPASSLMGLSLPILLFLLFGKVELRRRNSYYLSSLLIILTSALLVQSFILPRIYSNRSDTAVNIAKRDDGVTSAFSSCIRVHRDDSTVESAISHGLEWSKVRPDIAVNIDNLDKFKYAYFYNPATQQFHTASGKKVEKNVVLNQSNCVVLMDVHNFRKLE